MGCTIGMWKQAHRREMGGLIVRWFWALGLCEVDSIKVGGWLGLGHAERGRQKGGNGWLGWAGWLVGGALGGDARRGL